MTTLITVLNVAIGLSLTYLVTSLIISAAQELLSALFGLRATNLKSGLMALLDQAGSVGGGTDALSKRVFSHGLVARLSPNGQPSYIPVRNLTLALLDVLKDGSQAHEFAAIEQAVSSLPNGPIKQSLAVHLNEAGGDVDLLKTALDTWFDDAMDRISGVYKRKTQAIMFGFGLVVAVAVNVDSLHIANTLWMSSSSGTLGQAALDTLNRDKDLVSQLSAATPSNPPPADVAAAIGKSLGDLDGAASQLQNLPVPIGWFDAKGISVLPSKGQTTWLVVAAFGWLITAFAVSLGAPLWYSVLSGLMNIRSTGPKPAPPADKGATKDAISKAKNTDNTNG